MISYFFGERALLLIFRLGGLLVLLILLERFVLLTNP
jgi:hypothetical protein